MKKEGFKRITAFLLTIFCVCALFYGAASGDPQIDTPMVAAETGEHQTDSPNAPEVLFTADISAQGLVNIYDRLGIQPTGNVAVKMSTGEPPASNYLRPELIGDLVRKVDGTIVECNTAYGGSRSSTAAHWQVIRDHGLDTITEKGADIMDEEGYIEIPAQRGTTIHEDYVGSHLANYDSLISLAHFKGHAMAGYGGAIKNMSIGIASPRGKAWIHSGGTSTTNVWGGVQDRFLEAMGDATSGVVDYFSNKGSQVVYINVMNRISIDCDCDGNPSEPDMHDVGILASTDPVALDQACLDIVYNTDRTQSGSLINRIESRNGLYTLEHAEAIGLGSRSYRLVDIDNTPATTVTTTVTTTETTTETTTTTTTEATTETTTEAPDIYSVYVELSGSNGINFIAGVDSLNYREAGFIFEADGKSVRKGTDTVYTSIAGSSVDVGKEYKYAFTVTDIPDASKEIKVTPYVINTDGSESTYESRTFSIATVSENETTDKKILVAYFSAQNHTKGVAEAIADELKADTFVITPKESYTEADLNWRDGSSRVNAEHNAPDTRHIELVSNSPESFADYDIVFIGYPIWWGNASWVLDDFIKNNDFTGKTVIPFCTSQSSGLGESGKNLEEMAGTGNWLEGRRFSESFNEEEVRQWASSLKLD